MNDQVAINPHQVKETLKEGFRQIAPLWSLENFVAVNPYLNLADMHFADAMDFLSKSGDVQPTLPIAYYLKAIADGRVIREDIRKALENNEFGIEEEVDFFVSRLYFIDTEAKKDRCQTFGMVASEIEGKKWQRFMIDRISFWAAAYFDGQQAIWKTSDQSTSLYAAWKREATVDYAPEAMGLKGFRSFAKNLPADHLEAASLAMESLGISESYLKIYLNSLLLQMNGWAGYVARLDWEAHLEGKEGNMLEEFLTILLVWEMGMRELLNYPNLDYQWEAAKVSCEAMINKNSVSETLACQLILQDAYDIANQRTIIEKINLQPPTMVESAVKEVQAVFCIDVRSEIYRRNLEATSPQIETLGFAGFFAFPIKYVPLVHEQGTNQCPVLLTPTHTVRESLPKVDDERKAIKRRIFNVQFKKALKSFKQSAISCFGFVSPLGLFFLPKLLSDSLSYTKPVKSPETFGLSKSQTEQKGINLHPEEENTVGIPLEDRCQMAANALKAMSLTENFAPVVLIVGHTATTTNNPHASGLECGACGGHSGESNAKVAAVVLNDLEVRDYLSQTGINIPEETVFIAAVHNTTTDSIKLFEHDQNFTTSQRKRLQELKLCISLATAKSRKERAARMNIKEGNIQKKVVERSKDWSQVRPEWGLAGCSAFIIAPRERTQQLNFGGSAFMHNYRWQQDDDFKVLELIMTAPMVVTSWINLQYYASTVDNKRFGSGNKTLHNVVGGIGVLEGFAGDLRVGLPWQSVNDGEKYQHEPKRLNVIIEAPVDKMSEILSRHESIRNLCDNEWIYLFAMNDEGKVAYQYIGDLQWEVIAS